MGKSTGAWRYVNQRGVAYFLHVGKTKTGKPRYHFAKAIGEGALEQMPAGYRVEESINGVVSVARGERQSLVPDQDLELVRQRMGLSPHLKRYRADVRDEAIVVYEPAGANPAELEDLFPGARRVLEALPAKRFQPVLKFVRVSAGGTYSARRMVYRGGEVRWSYSLAEGSLSELLEQFLQHVGQESFFDLY